MKLLTNLIFEPKGKHDPALAYNIKDTVMSADGSKVYFALQDVPAGTALSNGEYWKLQIDLSSSKSAMDQALASFGNYAKEIGMRVKGEIAKASGNPVTFLPDAGSLLQPVTVLEPQQQGTGDPSPDNIRPISGYNTLGLTRDGKNLAYLTYRNMIPSVGSGYDVSAYGWASDYIPIDGSGAWVLSVSEVNTNAAEDEILILFLYDKDKNFIGFKQTASTVSMSIVANEISGYENAKYCRLRLSAINNTPTRLQFELGYTATSFEPYQGNTYTVQIGQTVYGGRFDWLTGKLVAEWAMKTLNGTEYFEHFSIAEGELFRSPLSDAYSETDIISDTYATVPNNQRRNFGLYANLAISGLDIIDSRFTSIDTFKANLTKNPVQIAYKLATPVEIQLSPTIISAADPEQTNTLYGDGNIEVEYVKPLHVSVEEHGGGGGISEEKDPTVPAWAKQPEKPKYTADEVGAASKEEFERLSEEIVEQGKAIAELKGEGEDPQDVLLIPGTDYVVTDSKTISLNVGALAYYILDASAGFYSVAEVDVAEGELYKISTTTKYNSGGYPDTIGIIFTDGTSGKYIAPTDYDIFLGVTSTSATRVNDAEVTIPAGAVKMFVNSMYISTDVNNGIVIKKVVGGGAKTPSEPLLYGKKLSVNGDSICYGAGATGGYGKIIADRCGMTVENLGVSGATIAAETYADDGVTAKHWICRTINQMDAYADFVILEGGVNDVTNADLGEFSPTNYDTVLDDTTFCGAFESMLKQAILHFDHAKICYLAVHKMSAGFSSNTEENSYYYAALAICKKWGIPVIDLNVAVPPLGMYTTNESLISLRQRYTHNGDGWHPNEAGYKRYYVDAIIAALKAL